MSESSLQASMAKRARQRNAWCRKVHGGQYGSGWPDLIGCYRGVFLALEVKLPHTRGTVTELQAETLKQMRKAGAVACVVYRVKHIDYLLDRIDESADQIGMLGVIPKIRRQAQARLNTSARRKRELESQAPGAASQLGKR